jgi:surface protein
MMNTMNLVFAIAVTLLGTANAANLRRAAAETGVTAADATVIATLRNKYDCRQAGATLAETLQNVANKNGQQLEALGKECKERTVNITALWTSAQETYATEFPKVEQEEVEQFSTAKNVADKTFQTLEKNRTDAVKKQEIEYNGTKKTSAIAAAAYTTAKDAWEDEKDRKKKSENKFNDVTLPAGKTKNAGAFVVAKQSANTTMNELITTATKLQATADGLCTDIKNEREKLIIADEDLLNNDIGPLIKTLSKLKCVDSYDATKAAAGAGNGVAFVQVDANVAAQCAMLSKKITALLGLSEQRSSTTATDAPIMAQLATFTARVSEEKTHMEKLYKECMAASLTIFHDEKNKATEDKKTEVDKAKAIQTAADAQLVTALASLVKDNDELVATKATEMEAPLATKKAAEAEANTALASVETAEYARKIDIPLAKKAQNATVLAAEYLKNGNIERRHTGLDETKQAANATFEEEKKFLDEYCESTEADLTKELVLVNQIFCKLGGLKVTDTAATGLEAEQNEEEQATPTVLVCPAPELPIMKVVEVAEPVVEAAVPVVEAAEPVVEAAKPVVEAAAAAKAKTNQNKPVPNGDGSCPTYKTTRTTGFGKLIDDWIAGDQSRIKVVAKYGKIENWNTKFVTNLKCVFSGSKNFNANLSQWDVSNVTTLEKGKFFIANY